MPGEIPHGSAAILFGVGETKALPVLLHSLGRDFAGVPGSPVYESLKTGEFSYRTWCFRKA